MMRNTLDIQAAPVGAAIHPDTTLGSTTLAVADAQRSLRFYRDFLGFQVLRTDDQQIVLGADGVPLLNLDAQPTLRPRPRPTTGLFHVAILLPSRLDLARVLRRLLEARYPIGASDHLVSEALYLDDPDGNGLEIYRDRPRAEWRRQPSGQIAMDTRQLDLADVLAELTPANEAWTGMPPGTRIGHMHLQVADLAQAEAFYHGLLGFDVMVRYNGALFLSAGGYHHHIGLNIWQSAGAPPPPPDVVGLRSFIVELPSDAARAEVQARLTAAGVPTRPQEDALAVDDPWGDTILLTVAPQ
jgi:catechol 2,3-dioxygenase